MYADAARSFSKALLIDRSSIRGRNGLAVALACQRHYRQAAKEWNTVLAYHPEDKAALQGLGMIQAALAKDSGVGARRQP
jgi:cytochrome c-type biogenesis protein CcmH/NrfG